MGKILDKYIAEFPQGIGLTLGLLSILTFFFWLFSSLHEIYTKNFIPLSLILYVAALKRLCG